MANTAQQTARTSRTVSDMVATISKTQAQIHHTANILPMPVVQSAGSRPKTIQPPTLKLSLQRKDAQVVPQMHAPRLQPANATAYAGIAAKDAPTGTIESTTVTKKKKGPKVLKHNYK